MRAAQARRRERHPRAETAGARYRAERAPDHPAAMSGPARRRTSRWYHDPVRPLDERGVRFKGRTMTDDDRHDDERDRAPEGLPAGGLRRRDLRALAGRRRLRARRVGSRADDSQPPFTLIQPPPNITGSLHIGHAQRTTVEDLMVRHARMSGRPTLFLPGLDHASIAAQVVLDRIIAKDGETAAARREGTSSGCRPSSPRRAR